MDLTTTYLGLSLKGPLIASASPLTGYEPIREISRRTGVSRNTIRNTFGPM